MSARRLLLLVVLGVLGVGLLVGAFFLARRVGLSPLAAALLTGWLSPLLVGGPWVLYAVAFHADGRRRNQGVPPAAQRRADGKTGEP